MCRHDAATIETAKNAMIEGMFKSPACNAAPFRYEQTARTTRQVSP
jgi:hypothetical protein